MKRQPNSSRRLAFVAAVSLAALAAACTTSGRRTSAEVEKDAPKTVVVQQPGKTTPVVSAEDRKYWLDLRQSKAALPRIHGALATGEAQAAEDMARAYLAQKPGDADGLTLLAAALSLGRKYELATYYATLAERARPGNAAALNIKGVATMLGARNRVADYKRAAEHFQAAFEQDSRQIAAGMNLGSLQLELGDARSAQGTFAAVARRCGDCQVGLMGYGIASARVRSFDAAKGAFEKVLAKNKSHPGALYHLALVHKNGYNDRKQAEKYLFALINESRGQRADVAMRERAHSVLRSMKGEATHEERTMIADGEAPAKDQTGDAELLMTSEAMSED